jgi:hypothetical protein
MAKPYLDWDNIRPDPFISWLSAHGLLCPTTCWSTAGLYPEPPVYVRCDNHTGMRNLVVRPKRKLLEMV